MLVVQATKNIHHIFSSPKLFSAHFLFLSFFHQKAAWHPQLARTPASSVMLETKPEVVPRSFQPGRQARIYQYPLIWTSVLTDNCFSSQGLPSLGHLPHHLGEDECLSLNFCLVHEKVPQLHEDQKIYLPFGSLVDVGHTSMEVPSHFTVIVSLFPCHKE